VQLDNAALTDMSFVVPGLQHAHPAGRGVTGWLIGLLAATLDNISPSVWNCMMRRCVSGTSQASVFSKTSKPTHLRTFIVYFNIIIVDPLPPL